MEVELRARSYRRRSTRMIAQVAVYERRDRWRRAAVTSLPLVGGALLAVPVPGVQLVAVPGLLAAAAVLWRRRLREKRVFESVRGPCPACGRALDVALASRGVLPHTLACGHCGEFCTLCDGGPHAVRRTASQA